MLSTINILSTVILCWFNVIYKYKLSYFYNVIFILCQFFSLIVCRLFICIFCSSKDKFSIGYTTTFPVSGSTCSILNHKIDKVEILPYKNKTNLFVGGILNQHKITVDKIFMVDSILNHQMCSR